MRKREKTIVFLLLLIFCQNLLAQDTSKVGTTDAIRLPFVFWGIDYEKKLTRNQTLVGSVNLFEEIGFGYSSNLGFQFSYPFIPSIGLQYRWYYNLNRRAAAGRVVRLNSGNYISARFRTSFPKNIYDQYRRPDNSAGLFFGLQRNYKKRFYLDLGAGCAYQLPQHIRLRGQDWSGIRYDVPDKFGFAAYVNFGIWLNKRSGL
jgi:hypothetical protein